MDICRYAYGHNMINVVEVKFNPVPTAQVILPRRVPTNFFDNGWMKRPWSISVLFYRWDNPEEIT